MKREHLDSLLFFLTYIQTYRANVILDLEAERGVLDPDLGVLNPEFDSDE